MKMSTRLQRVADLRLSAIGCREGDVLRARGRGRWRYCKYCYRQVVPLILREHVNNLLTDMTICGECGAGLDPPERVPS